MIKEINNVSSNKNMLFRRDLDVLIDDLRPVEYSEVHVSIWGDLVEFVDFNWNIVQSNIMNFRK